MVDVATLGFAVQTAPLEKGAQSLDRMTVAAQKTSVAAEKVSVSTKKMNTGFASNNARMMAMQLSQVAQQTSATGNFIQALAIQLPDLTLGFGVIGIAAGVAAGALLPLAANMVMSGEKAKTMTEATDDLSVATKAYKSAVDDATQSASDLIERFGTQADQANRLYGLLMQISQIDFTKSLRASQVALQNSLEGVASSIDRYNFASKFFEQKDAVSAVRSEVQELENQFGLTLIQATRITNALDDMKSANAPLEVANAAEKLAMELQRAQDEGAKLPQPLMEAQRGAAQAAIDALDFANALGLAADNAASVAVQMANVSSLEYGRIANTGGVDAIARAGNLQNATDIVGNLASGAGGVRAKPKAGRKPQESDAANLAKRQVETYKNLVANQNEYIKKLGVEADAVGRADQAARAMVIAQDLMTQAQANNAKLTPRQTQELLALADATAAAEITAEKAKESFDFARDLAGGFFSDLKSGLQNGESFWDAFKNAALNALDKITDRLLNQVLDAVFQVSGAGKSGGGNILSQLIGGIFGIGGRASGGPVGANTPYIVGERGPELFVPGTYGSVVANRDMGRAANQNGGGTVVNVIDNAGVQKREERQRGPNGEDLVNIVLERTKEDMARGGYDGALGGRFGAKPVRVRRGAGA